MLGSQFGHILRALFLLFFQVLVLQNIHIAGILNPYVYVLFLLLLPIEINGLLFMALSFFYGLSIDVFTKTYGMHAMASVLLAYFRPTILKLLAPRDGYEFGSTPTIHSMGFLWFISYAGINVVLHHIFLFLLEAFKFQDLLYTITKALLSSLLTLLLIVLFQYIGGSSSKKITQ